MGCYDVLIIKCPRCNGKIEFQSKAGGCSLTNYSEKDVTPDIAGDLDGESEICPKCDSMVSLCANFTIHAYLGGE